MGAVEHLVARAGIALDQELDQLVGPGAADDPRLVQPVASGDRRPEVGRGTVRITVQIAGEGPVGGDGARAGAARALVRSQPDRLPSAGPDRKRAVEGQRVSVSFDLCGRRSHTKINSHLTQTTI